MSRSEYWTKQEDDILIKGRASGLTMGAISILIGNRTILACQARAQQIGLQKKIPSCTPLRSPAAVKPSAQSLLTDAEKDKLYWGDAKFEDENVPPAKCIVFSNPLPEHNSIGCAARMSADLGAKDGKFKSKEAEEKNRIATRERARTKAALRNGK